MTKSLRVHPNTPNDKRTMPKTTKRKKLPLNYDAAPAPKRVKKKAGKHKAARRRHMLDTADLRWKAGREPKTLKVTGHPLNRRLVQTDEGYVAVADSKRFGKGIEIPVWCEPGGERMYCKGEPREVHRW